MENKGINRLLLDAIREPLLLLHRDGTIEFANAAARRLFGAPGSRIQDSDPVHAGDSLHCNEILNLINRHESVTGYPLRDADGRPLGATADVETIRVDGEDELKLMHVHLPSAETRDELWKDELIAMVAHEIKNPLAAMKHSMEILLSRAPGGLTESQQRFLTTSTRSIGRLTRLVDGFLDVSRIRSGAFVAELSRTDVVAFVSDVTESFASLDSPRRVDLTWRVEPGAEWGDVDGPKLEQVLINLLSNALKYTPENGAISVEVKRAGVETLGEDMRLLPWNQLGRPRILQFAVRDTGLGMSTETLANAYRRYSPEEDETRPRGAHLGLNISRALVEALNGWMSMESALGLGTTVRVGVPQDRATANMIARVANVDAAIRGAIAQQRRVGLCLLGKFSDDRWDDIAGSWVEQPVINPDHLEIMSHTFAMWTVNSEVAVTVCIDPPPRNHIAQLFGVSFVECDEEAYVFDNYAVGACELPREATSTPQLFNIATARMGRAKNAVARASIEAMDSRFEYVTHALDDVTDENRSAKEE